MTGIPGIPRGPKGGPPGPIKKHKERLKNQQSAVKEDGWDAFADGVGKLAGAVGDLTAVATDLVSLLRDGFNFTTGGLQNLALILDDGDGKYLTGTKVMSPPDRLDLIKIKHSLYSIPGYNTTYLTSLFLKASSGKTEDERDMYRYILMLLYYEHIKLAAYVSAKRELYAEIERMYLWGQEYKLASTANAKYVNEDYDRHKTKEDTKEKLGNFDLEEDGFGALAGLSTRPPAGKSKTSRKNVPPEYDNFMLEGDHVPLPTSSFYYPTITKKIIRSTTDFKSKDGTLGLNDIAYKKLYFQRPDPTDPSKTDYLDFTIPVHHDHNAFFASKIAKNVKWQKDKRKNNDEKNDPQNCDNPEYHFKTKESIEESRINVARGASLTFSDRLKFIKQKIKGLDAQFEHDRLQAGRCAFNATRLYNESKRGS